MSQLSQLLPELRLRYPQLSPPPLEQFRPDADVSQALFYEPLIQYTLALAKLAPLVIFVDDLQWTDSATLNLLHYAIRRWQDSAARVLLIVSLRSESLHPIIQPNHVVELLTHAARELPPVNIELDHLGEWETVQILTSILVPPTPDFAQWVYDETRGHPYYLKETLKDLLERCVLVPKRQSEGEWTFSVDAEHNLGQTVRVPSTVSAVIRSRLFRLSPHAFSLLVGSAVLDKRITFEHLCAVANVSEDLAFPALDELLSGRLLLEAPQTDVDSTYAFTNDMLRDVVYTEAGDARRRLFHRRALWVLEAEMDSAAILAHHALAGGLAQAAFNHSLSAGQDALRISAVTEAIVHFERAHQLVREASPPDTPDMEDRLLLYAQLGKAYTLSGQAEQALEMDAERDRLG